ncbi:hypothetical protein L1887_16561 [Cichorium endivia]|nr:hypothetical protein L1887_16561 [Cichorium endivia]
MLLVPAPNRQARPSPFFDGFKLMADGGSARIVNDIVRVYGRMSSRSGIGWGEKSSGASEAPMVWVESGEPDLKTSQVSVKNMFMIPQLVDYIHKTGKHIVIVKQDREPKKEDDKDQTSEWSHSEVDIALDSESKAGI